ncbi:MAG: NAD-dependent dehydratase, partial [Chloroflexota bacterium]
PITLYGSGTMTRAFLPLRDSMRCLTLAVENPADEGEFRVFNQFAESYSIRDLAHMVQEVGSELGLDVTIKHYDNPRVEKEQHYYEPIREGLDELGYEPTMDVKSEMRIMMTDLLEHQDLIKEKSDILVPDIRWDGSRERSEELETPAETV